MQSHSIDPAFDGPPAVDVLAYASGALEEIGNAFDDQQDLPRYIVESMNSEFGPSCPKCGKREAEYEKRTTVDRWKCRGCNWTWFAWSGRGGK